MRTPDNTRERSVCGAGLAVLAALALASPLAAEEPATATAPPAAGRGPASDGAAPSARTLRERLIAESIEAGSLAGAFVTLGAGEAAFTARYERARKQRPDGLLLVVPRRDSFVGRDPLVDAYTQEFPENGWSVLAVQMPLLSQTADAGDYEAGREEAARRVCEALAYARSEGSYPIVVAAHAQGAPPALSCLSAESAPFADAFASVGTWQGEIGGVSLPVLEVIGEEDARGLEFAGQRLRTAERDPARRYEQFVLPGANAAVAYHEAAIARRLRGWIERTVENPDPRENVVASGDPDAR